MKISKVLVAALLSLLTSASYAVTVGTRSNVTVALTLSDSVGGFVVDGEVTEEKSTEKETSTSYTSTFEKKNVVKTEKFTNKELLLAMKEDGMLDDNITGWSLVMIDGYAFYAIKKGLPAVEVPVELSFQDAEAVAYTVKYTSVDDYAKESRNETFTESGAGKILGNVFSQFFMVELQGLATFSYKTVKGKLGTGESAQVYGGDNEDEAFYLGGASKLSSLTGKSTDGTDGLVEGSLSFSAETVVDLELIGIQLGIGPL